jgi:hypothetical protein
VVAGDEKPKPVEGAKLEGELKPEPKVGVVPAVMKEVVGNVDPNPPPNAPPAGAKEVAKLGVVVPNDGVGVAPKEKGEVEVANIEPVVPNEPNQPEGAPKGLVPKLVAGVELKEPNPEPKAGVVVGVVAKVPKELPKGELVVLPNELVVLPKEKGLLLAAVPNIPPEPMAAPVPKGELEAPNGLVAPAVPKVLVVPKGEAACVGAPPWCSQRSSSKLLLA